MTTPAKVLLDAILGSISFTDPQTLNINSGGLSNVRERWNTLSSIAKVAPNIICNDDIANISIANVTPIKTFYNSLTKRIISNAIPTAVELNGLSRPTLNWDGSNMIMLKIPTPIYDVVSVMLWIHWCLAERPNLVPRPAQRLFTAEHIANTENTMLVYAAKQIASIAAINPQLWGIIRDVYTRGVNDHNLGWMFDNIYIQFTMRWGELKKTQGIIGIAYDPLLTAQGNQRDFAKIITGFSALIECTATILDYLQKPLSEYLRGIAADNHVEIGGDADMNTSLQLLNQLLKESVVINAQGEMLNVHYDDATGALAITPRDSRDPVSHVDGRPMVTHCKVMLNGEEHDIVHLSEDELSNIMESMRRVIEVNNATIAGEVSDGRVSVQRRPREAMPDVNARVDETGTVVPNGNPDIPIRVLYSYDNVPPNPNAGDYRRNRDGSYSIYNTVMLGGAEIGMWSRASDDDIRILEEDEITGEEIADAVMRAAEGPAGNIFGEPLAVDLHATPVDDMDDDLEDFDIEDDYDDYMREEADDYEDDVVPIATPTTAPELPEDVPVADAPTGRWMRLPNGQVVNL